MMKRIAFSLTLLVAFALPATAAENPCATVTVGHDGWTYVEDLDYQDGAPKTSIEGYFLVVSWSDNPTGGDGWQEALSFDATNLDTATVCADGSVTLVELPVESDAGVELSPPAPAPAPVTLTPVCEVYAATLEYVCSLPNLTLRVS